MNAADVVTTATQIQALLDSSNLMLVKKDAPVYVIGVVGVLTDGRVASRDLLVLYDEDAAYKVHEELEKIKWRLNIGEYRELLAADLNEGPNEIAFTIKRLSQSNRFVTMMINANTYMEE